MTTATVVEIDDEVWAEVVERLTLQRARATLQALYELRDQMTEYFETE
jgi:Arc/MetJ family transcription regulator